MNPKIQKILDIILCDDFILENSRSEDYCKYCHSVYGNYVKFGYINKSVEDNHKEDCLYRLAYEIEKSKNVLEQNPIIWGEGWYAILDGEKESLWYVAPKKYFEEKGFCPDGWEWDKPEGMTEDEFEDFVDEHGYEPEPPKGFTYCMESCMKCTEDWDVEKQKEILRENGFIVDNVPRWGWDR